MAARTVLALADARTLAARYGLRVGRVEPVHGGRVNSNFRVWSEEGESAFIRIYEQQDPLGARRELGLVSELGRVGVPTPSPLARLDGGGRLCEHSGKPVALFPWVDGQWVCQRSVTPGLCHTVGSVLAGLHRATPLCHRAPQGRFDLDALRQRLDVVAVCSNADLVPAAAAVRHKLETYDVNRDRGLPSGITHGDLFRENVLWKRESLVAIVDFECACHGPFVYDLMVCVLAWCYGSSFEWPLVRAMLEGYASRRMLSSREAGAIAVEAAVACLRFATTRLSDFSMRAGPEGPERDYRRFLQRLAELEAGAARELTELGMQIRSASGKLTAQQEHEP